MRKRTTGHYRNKPGTCLHCGKDFLGLDTCRAMFCSLKCRYDYQTSQTRVEISCKACGQQFTTTRGRQRAKDLKYCSKQCSDTRHQPKGEVLAVIEMLRAGQSVTEVCKTLNRRRDGVLALQRRHCPETIVKKEPNVYTECHRCGKAKLPNGYINCDSCNSKTSRLKYKQIVADAYGGKCACCGEANLAFLTIDHIFNDGAAHRREEGDKVNNLWRYVRLNNFPKDRFQLLCYNCNCAKQYNGGCPHKLTDK